MFKKRIDILVVEDSPTQSEQLKYMLEELGHFVNVAANGNQALDKLRETQPTLVISDIVMPEMDGYTLCQKIKSDENLKNIPVILVTALSDPDDIMKGLESGADNFVTKPYERKYLLKIIQQILINYEFQQVTPMQMGVEIFFRGQKYFITAERLQILNLLLSTYETAVQKNLDLIKAQNELKKLNEELEEKVNERTSALVEEIAGRKRSQEQLSQSRTELAMRNKIATIFLTTPDDEMYNEVLKVVLKVMESKYGVFGYIDEDGALVVPSMTRHIWDKCQVHEKTFVFPRETWGESSWPQAIKEKKIHYTNETSYLVPKGHVAISRHISMPLIYQGEVIGLIQVANKQTDYEQKDIQVLETIGNQIAPILHARLQRDREEKQRMRVEEKLLKSNRSLKTLSSCNEALVRAKDESELLKTICQILIDIGGYRLAWVGFAEQDEAQTVLPKAYAGYEEGFLENIKLTWSDSKEEQCPAGTAIRTGNPGIVHDFRTDPKAGTYHEEALKRGYISAIGLPLNDNSHTFGVLAIYASEPDIFNDDEVNLLTELSNDLAYGIMALRTRDERSKSNEALHRIEWMLTPKKHDKEDLKKARATSSYGDLIKLNTARLILDSIGEETLNDIAKVYIDLLETSAAIYEKNGDYALGIFASGWCQFLDCASRKLCQTEDNREALNSGKWLCHESCWTNVSKVAIETGQPVDIVCNGEIHLYALPVWADGQVVGSISIGYGDPPKEPEELQRLAEKYAVDANELMEKAKSYESRPFFIIEIAKERLQTSAKLIGSMIEHKRAEEKILRREEDLKKRMKELEDFYEMGIGRELRMIELKKEIESLKEELAKYKKT